MIDYLRSIEITFTGGYAIFFLSMSLIGIYECIKELVDKTKKP